MLMWKITIRAIQLWRSHWMTPAFRSPSHVHGPPIKNSRKLHRITPLLLIHAIYGAIGQISTIHGTVSTRSFNGLVTIKTDSHLFMAPDTGMILIWFVFLMKSFLWWEMFHVVDRCWKFRFESRPIESTDGSLVHYGCTFDSFSWSTNDHWLGSWYHSKQKSDCHQSRPIGSNGSTYSQSKSRHLFIDLLYARCL